MRPEQRVGAIESRLRSAFQPEALEVEDESHLHAGHPGARDGRGHYRVMIVSPAFEGLSLIQRHRQVYQALDEMMDTDIHALSIEAYSSSDL